MFNNIDGDGNTAIGANFVLTNNTHGGYNTATGDFALASNIDGNDNTAHGVAALSNNTHGSSNTALGANAGQGVTTANNVICIGAFGADVANSCYIGNIWNQSSRGGVAVFVNSDGKLGTTISSQRFKEGIKPMDEASEAILALQPVTFHYKKEFDPTGTAQFGLVAEHVEKINPDLVVRDKGGEPYSVRYDQVNAMLLNEFLKEHRKNKEQEATIAELKSTVTRQQKQIEALTAGLQKVSVQLELREHAPQVVATDQ